MRVLFLGDYPLDVGLQKYSVGLYPSHNLFGLVELPRLGVETAVAVHGSSSRLDKVFQRFGLGNSIASQLNVLRMVRRGDIIFSICLPSVGLLALLKRLGFLRNPLVTLVHHPAKRSQSQKLILGANDRLFFLSKNGLQTCRQIHGLKKIPMAVLPWGPQREFYAPAPLPAGPLHVVAAGKSSRDYRTLVAAARQVDIQLTIVCPRARFPDLVLPPNVTWIGGMVDEQPLEESELTALYQSAHVIAVPLVKTGVLAGLTSLLDALAIHRPVIITRNANIDIDVVAEDVGWITEPGDVSSWITALGALKQSQERLEQMSRNAARLCDEKIGMNRFASALKAELLAMECK